MKCTVLLLLLLGAEVGALAATGIFSIDSISVLAQEQEDEMIEMDGGGEGEEGGRDPISYVTEYIGIFAIGTSFGLLIAPSIIGRNIESIPELKIRSKVFVFISVIALTIAVGIIHIFLIKEHMKESYIWGIGFLVMGILQLLYGGVFIMLIKTQA